MAKRRSNQKHGLDRGPSNLKRQDADPGPGSSNKEGTNFSDVDKVAIGDEVLRDASVHRATSINDMDNISSEKKIQQNTKKSMGNRKGPVEAFRDTILPRKINSNIGKSDTPTGEGSNSSSMPHRSSENTNDFDAFGTSPERLDGADNVQTLEFPETIIFRYINMAALSVSRASAEWIESYKPTFIALKLNILKVSSYVHLKIEHARPIFFRWIVDLGNITLLLLMAWLACSLRGIDSFMRMGTTSFLSIIWCSVLSVIAMIGTGKFLVGLAIAVGVGLFLGFTLAVVLTCIAGMICLWLYGSFWTTGLIIFLGGLAFTLSHDRIALFITTVYSIYCAWSYVGFLGMALGFNLSFISSDALLFLMKNTINEQRRANSFSEEESGRQGPASFFANDSMHSGVQPDCSPGVPSTSGSFSEMTSEDEVVRLLNCKDHYSALGLSRFENIDVSIIKREYRKKAMLVHPDKNMGNEKAAEAFMKLQSAYEILLDSFKRKEYDDVLRREELLNYFRKFQNPSREENRHGFFWSNFTRAEPDNEDTLGESRQISCKKCGFFHVWVFTKKLKSKARWCQECKDFHPAKDGEGWLEQSTQPFLLGILQKVEAPVAYVCADSKVYNATAWYICQGMKCPVNTHKPAFHVNTSAVAKSGHGRGTGSAQRSGIPAMNLDKTMTEEEFVEWLQNAMQNGMFEKSPGSTTESASGSTPKGGASSSGSSSTGGNKKKKKGKRQW